MNCEDLAFNFLVSHITRQPPIKVKIDITVEQSKDMNISFLIIRKISISQYLICRLHLGGHSAAQVAQRLSPAKTLIFTSVTDASTSSFRCTATSPCSTPSLGSTQYSLKPEYPMISKNASNLYKV